MRVPVYLIPVFVFAVLAGFFSWRLILVDQGDAPSLIPSVMIGKPAPDFDIPLLKKEKARFKTDDFKGRVTLVNFFASWCAACRTEHPFLSQLSGQGFALVGIDYKDKPQDGLKWLARHGDPYDVAAQDIDGRVGIDFGVYGVPESYLIDKAGVIRFKQTGPITPGDIETKILPLVKELNQ